MGAPQGNQFWKLRSKHGRDKIFQSAEELWSSACEYFQWCDDNPWVKNEQKKSSQKIDIMELMAASKSEGIDFKNLLNDVNSNLVEIPTARPYTIQGLCLYLDCGVNYFNQFEDGLKEKDDAQSKDFSLILTRIRETIYQQKFEGAAVGAFNPSIIARDLGLADKQEVNAKVETKQPDLSNLSDEELSVMLKAKEIAEKIKDSQK